MAFFDNDIVLSEGLSMKVYHVQGIRHSAVIFAKTQEEAIAEAAEKV